jgi:NitT/TauT family transport system substrate-binding protein
MNRRLSLQSLAAGAALASAALFSPTTAAQDKVVFGTNWFAQPGHGGFYQAVVDGTYKK